MGKSTNDLKSNNDEFTRIFDEYRAKIDEITRKTEQNLQSINGITDVVDDRDDISDADTTAEVAAPPEPEAAIPQMEPEPVKKPVEVIWPSEKESVEIIKQAKRKAQEIISEAEATIKKEAKKRTQTQVDKIIGKAKKEAEYIIVQASETAEKLRNDAVANSRQEVEELLGEITEKCRQDTRAQSSRIIAEAREKADKMMAEIATNSTEINRLVTDIVNRARNTISEFEERLQAETGELARAITETQQKLEEATMIEPEPEPEPVQGPPAKIREIYSNPTLEVHLFDRKSSGNREFYSGQMEMRTASSSFDYQYMKKLKKYLINLPGIKYLQESASEKEMSVLFDVEEPLPLLDILRDVPMVDKVVTESDSDICLVFKGSE
jgi:F0F1-type ATP synthase membrane subunit b/b'